MVFTLLGDDYGDYGPQDESEAALGLPSDSRSIRDQLVDVFSCEGRPYGKETRMKDVFPHCFNNILAMYFYSLFIQATK